MAEFASISVVVPAHNHARFIREALESIQRQTLPPREIVVVDDGSTDDTAAMALSLNEPRLRLLRQKNSGPSAARNHGWRAARADSCFFLDADDRLPPRSLQALAEAAAAHPGALPYGVQAVYPEDMSGEPAFTATMSTRNGNLLEEIAVYYRGTIFTSLFSRRALEDIGGFDDAVWFGEDFDFAIRAALKREFRHVPELVYEARMHGRNRHRTFSQAGQKQYLATVRKNLAPPGAVRAACYNKAMAQWHWRFGCEDLNEGNKAGAMRHFVASLRRAPWKIGSWRGLARSVALKPIRANPGREEPAP